MQDAGRAGACRCSWRSCCLGLAPLARAEGGPPGLVSWGHQTLVLAPGEATTLQVTFANLPLRRFTLLVESGGAPCDLNVRRDVDGSLLYDLRDEVRHELDVPWGTGESLTAVLTAGPAGGSYDVSFWGPPAADHKRAYSYHVNRALESHAAGDLRRRPRPLPRRPATGPGRRGRGAAPARPRRRRPTGRPRVAGFDRDPARRGGRTGRRRPPLRGAGRPRRGLRGGAGRRDGRPGAQRPRRTAPRPRQSRAGARSYEAARELGLPPDLRRRRGRGPGATARSSSVDRSLAAARRCGTFAAAPVPGAAARRHACGWSSSARRRLSGAASSPIRRCSYRTLEARGHTIHWAAFREQYPRFLFPGTEQTGQTAEWLLRPNLPRFVPWSPWSWWRTARDLRAWAPEAVVVQYWLPFFAPGFWGVLAACASTTPGDLRAGQRGSARDVSA